MNKQIRIVLSFILCFVFVGALGNAPQAQAAPTVPTQHQDFKTVGDFITGKATDMATAEAVAHWTPDAFQAAKPMGLVSVSASNTYDNYTAAGGPGYKAGGMPDPEILSKFQTESMNFRQSQDLPTLQTPSQLVPYGTKNTYDGYYVNYYDAMWMYYPYSTVGKLYFTDGVYDYWCSASLISGNNILVTAAHCVYNTDYNYLYYNWVFVPAESGGTAPLLAYAADNYLFWTKWAAAKKSSAALSWDLALLHLAPTYYNSSYYYPSDVAGWLGYAWNVPPKYLEHTLGYADNMASGYYSYMCVAESFSGKGGLGMGCNMTFGSSGAPWIIGFQPYYSGYVNAVVSSGNPSVPTFYGPRFTNKNFSPMCDYWGC
jgi:V8-like Glu-specific endopeptidase